MTGPEAGRGYGVGAAFRGADRAPWSALELGSGSSRILGALMTTGALPIGAEFDRDGRKGKEGEGQMARGKCWPSLAVDGAPDL